MEDLSGLVRYLKEEEIAEMSVTARFDSEKMKSDGKGRCDTMRRLLVGINGESTWSNGEGR
jgi:hypothetical protein